jgi:hypothetical protein
MTVGIRQNRIILLLLQDIFSEEGTEGLRDEETEVRCQRSDVRGRKVKTEVRGPMSEVRCVTDFGSKL